MREIRIYYTDYKILKKENTWKFYTSAEDNIKMDIKDKRRVESTEHCNQPTQCSSFPTATARNAFNDFAVSKSTRFLRLHVSVGTHYSSHHVFLLFILPIREISSDWFTIQLVGNAKPPYVMAFLLYVLM
jgi:hypothetical protein